jgi:hypothetical protein
VAAETGKEIKSDAMKSVKAILRETWRMLSLHPDRSLQPREDTVMLITLPYYYDLSDTLRSTCSIFRRQVPAFSMIQPG